MLFVTKKIKSLDNYKVQLLIYILSLLFLSSYLVPLMADNTYDLTYILGVVLAFFVVSIIVALPFLLITKLFKIKNSYFYSVMISITIVFYFQYVGTTENRPNSNSKKSNIPVTVDEFEMQLEYAKNVQFEEVVDVTLVKISLDYYYGDDPHKISQVPIKITIEKFDSAGQNLLRLIYFTPNREVETAITYKYDNYGNGIQRWHYSDEKTLDNMTLYKNTYENGKLVRVEQTEISFYSSDTTYNTYNPRYDDKGNQIGHPFTKREYDKQGRITALRSGGGDSLIYFYNEAGQKIESRHYMEKEKYIPYSDKRTFSKDLYFYDSLGRNNKISDYSADGTLYQVITYEYDITDRKTKRTVFKRDNIKTVANSLIAKEVTRYIYEDF